MGRTVLIFMFVLQVCVLAFDEGRGFEETTYAEEETTAEAVVDVTTGALDAADEMPVTSSTNNNRKPSAAIRVVSTLHCPCAVAFAYLTQRFITRDGRTIP